MLPALKTKKITVARLDGLSLTIHELSGRDMEQVSQAQGVMIAALIAKLGVVEWADHTVEDIGASIGAFTLRDIGNEIYKLTGIDTEKNSAPDQGAVSISG